MSTDTEEGSDTKQPPLPPLSGRQKFFLFMMCIICFFTYLTMGVIAPFFPGEATAKGATLSEIGLIFGMYNISKFVFTLIIGNFVGTIGAKFLYLTGMFVRGTGDIIFGFLTRIPDGETFVIYCFIVRAVESLGSSMFSTAMYAIVAKEFSDRVSATFSVLQMFIGMGMMLGPTIGGLLYDVGGFAFPFLVLGGIMLLVAAISAFTMPTPSTGVVADNEFHDAEGNKSIKKKKYYVYHLMLVPQIAVNIVMLIFGFMPFVFVEISLEAHLSQFGLSPGLIGLMFSCTTASYSISSLFWGYVNKKASSTHCRKQMVVGGFMYGIGCLFVGPAPWMPFDTQLWLVALSLVCMGIGASAFNVAGYTDTLHQTKVAGFPQTVDTFGLVSGVHMFCISFGAFLGPSVGSPLVEVRGFRWAVALFGYIAMGIAVIVGPIKFVNYRYEQRVKAENKRRAGVGTKSNGTVVDGERVRLLDSEHKPESVTMSNGTRKYGETAVETSSA